MKKFKKVAAVLMTASLAAGLAGCGSSASNKEQAGNSDAVTADAAASSETETGASSVSEPIVLKYGATGWKNTEALLEAAGLDHYDGYTVETTVFQGGNLCLEALAADQIDFTGTSEIPPIAASLAENGGNFKIVLINSSSPQNQELVALKSSDFKSVADLKGKKVGYIKSTTAQYFLNEMLKQAGLSWNDIDAVEVTTTDGVTALIGGDIDAFASYGNSINAAKANGAVTLADAVSILSGNFPFEISETVLKDDAKVAAIADYLARVQKAYEWAEDNLDKWAQISAEPTGSTYEDTLDLLQRTYDDRGYLDDFIGIDDGVIASEQSVADSFYELGLLDQKVDASTFYDDSFYKVYEKALANLK